MKYEKNNKKQNDRAAAAPVMPPRPMPDAVLADTSSLAWRIDEKPELTLPDAYQKLPPRE